MRRWDRNCIQVLFRCPQAVFDLGLSTMVSMAKPLVDWDYANPPTLPGYVDKACKDLILSKRKFWLIEDNYVTKNGCFPPLKLFKQAAQSFYSKVKAGVEGTTQKRAVLRSSTSHLIWEQKIVSQTIEFAAINAYFAWRMVERQDLLECAETFRSIEIYRNSLNKHATTEFIYDVFQ